MQDQATRQLWIEIIEAERLRRYFRRLADMRRKWHNGLSAWALVGGAIVEAILLVQRDFFALFLVVLALAPVVMKHIRKDDEQAVAAHLAAVQFEGAMSEWKRRWYSGKQLESDDITRVRQQVNAVVFAHHILADETLNKKCTGEAYDAISQEFGTS